MTWAHGVAIPDRVCSVRPRTRTDGAWTRWSAVPYDPDHGPDPGSAEARHARPGTEPCWSARSADVQVRVVSAAGRCRPDMKLAVIAPGQARHSAEERAAIDTSTHGRRRRRRLGLRRRPRWATAPPPELRSRRRGRASPPRSSRPQPVIYSRKQWGADERIRGKSSLHYGDVHAGLRAPHGQRQRLHACRGAGPPAQHLRLPREVPRLERHRLQLPRRPLRPDLGGPVRRRRPRRSSAPTPWATTTTRSPPRRSATTRSPSPARR